MALAALLRVVPTLGTQGRAVGQPQRGSVLLNTGKGHCSVGTGQSPALEATTAPELRACAAVRFTAAAQPGGISAPYCMDSRKATFQEG